MDKVYKRSLCVISYNYMSIYNYLNKHFSFKREWNTAAIWIDLKSFMLSERSNLQKEFIDMYLPCAREGKVGKMLIIVAFLRDNWNVLKLDCGECTKKHWIVHLKWVNFYDVWIISELNC